jgi:hypothetical protein
LHWQVAPLAQPGFYGRVGFHRAGRLAGSLRLLQEMTIPLLAAAAVHVAGQQLVALALISIVHDRLVYSLGDNLLKH